MKVEATPEQDAMVQAFARAIEQAGGKALLVGGLVRDEILGLPSKDFDFEVFGLPMERVQQILSQFGNVKEVGQQFGVLNIQELDWDVALPRREQKTGEGHKGFDVVPDPTMTVEDAARRRDLTINALSKDPLTGEIIDPLNGMADLQAGILRMADPNTFGDDPLRALRVAQFASRFDFDVDPETLKVVAAQPLEELPGERILPEFSKMLLKGKKPSKGIETLRQANLLRYFPEIEALQGVPQDKIHHPEGDVYVHTLMVLDEAGKQRTGDPAFDLPLMLGALSHDFGKPEFTQHVDDRIKSHGHEEGGEAPTREFLQRMKAPNELTDQVATLVSTHLRPSLMAGEAGRKGYRKLSRLLADNNVSPELLTAVSKADNLGRTTDSALRRDTSRQDQFLQEYDQYVTSQAPEGGKLVDSVSGKHLIAKGFKPGPDMGKFLALTRSIEDETGITDPDKLIELATRFLSDRSEGAGSRKEGSDLDCGDSHIRPGEECHDGEYREKRKQGLTKSDVLGSGKGPSGFRTHPDKTQPDFLLWEHFEMPPDQKGKALHPGLATGEPQRLHERTESYPGVKDFDRGSRFSEHPLEGPLGRDGFGGSTPAPQKPLFTGPNGMTPENGNFPYTDSDLHGHGQPDRPPTHPHEHDIPELPATDPHEFEGLDYLDWDKPPTQADIGPDHREPFPGAEEFPKSEYPNDKGAGYLATELPHPQLLEDPLPNPSPPRTTEVPESLEKQAESAESPPSSYPGQVYRHPGGGGLDRAPMQRPNGKPSGVGFLPVQNQPDPKNNMFKAETVEAFDPMDVHGPGGNNPGGTLKDQNRGGRGGGTDYRPYWDADWTGKKTGFMSIEPPQENIYPADVEDVEAARTIEDLMDIESIFPHNYNPEWGDGGVSMPPHLRHQNVRKTHDQGLNPFPKLPPVTYIDDSDASVEADDDANIEQKQVQPLIPNQKMAIAVDPKGPMGERIVIMSPLFEEVSPAIMALRSHRFERHGGIVIDGPPEWLLGITPRLEALDKSSAHDGADDLFARVMQLIQSAGMPVEYTQDPRP